MEWTNEERLQLISALIEKSFDFGRPLDQSHKLLMLKIIYLCDRPPEFLEKHRWNFEDVLTTPPKGQLECLATSEISCGVLIAATMTKDGHFTIAATILYKDGYYVLYPPSLEEEIIIGKAARDIQSEDIVSYIPHQNTADILTKGELTEKTVGCTWAFETLEDQMAARVRLNDAMKMKSIYGVER